MKKIKYLFVDAMLFILDLISILIFFIRPHIHKYLIFFFILDLISDLIFFFNKYSLYYFGFFPLDLYFFVFFLCDLINNIRDITYLDFYFVMLILHSIFTKDVTLFNYLFWFFLLYLYILR
jgi:hypothetical protein